MLRWPFGRRDWCCSPFQQLYENCHGRSLFVFVLPRSSLPGFSFWLAMRSVTRADLARGPLRIAPDDVPITISTSRPIGFCPFCGVNLSRFYAARHASMIDAEICLEFASDLVT